MRRVVQCAAVLYPAAWRSRYGAELEALIEDAGGGWRELWDVCIGAMKMQIRMGSFWRFVAGCAVAGVLIAAAMVWRVPSQYLSTAVLRMPSGDQEESREALNKAEQNILSRHSLSSLIQRFDLYRGDRARDPLEEIVERMRNREIQIRLIQPAGAPQDAGAFSIAFASDSPKTAQAVTSELTAEFVTAMKSSSPLEVLDPASLPERAFTPNRTAWIGSGLVFGTTGALIVLGIRRWPRIPLAGLAVALLVWPATYLIPSQFRSMAVLRSKTVDAGEVAGTVLNDHAFLQNLATQFQLFPGAKDPVQQMRQSIKVQALQGGQGKACLVTFDYSDRYKSQIVLREIVARAGAVEVLDPPSLAEKPFTPNRVGIVACALLVGFAMGAISRILLRRSNPAIVA